MPEWCEVVVEDGETPFGVQCKEDAVSMVPAEDPDEPDLWVCQQHLEEWRLTHG